MATRGPLQRRESQRKDRQHGRDALDAKVDEDPNLVGNALIPRSVRSPAFLKRYASVLGNQGILRLVGRVSSRTVVRDQQAGGEAIRPGGDISNETIPNSLTFRVSIRRDDTDGKVDESGGGEIDAQAVTAAMQSAGGGAVVGSAEESPVGLPSDRGGRVTRAPVIHRQQEDGQLGAAKKADHYAWEIKAWIPFAQVPDPEEALQEARFRLSHLGDEVSDYHSQYLGDAHAGYAGPARVIHRVEFDWDGTVLSNFTVIPLPHFGTTHREFSAVVKPIGGIQPRTIRDVEAGTTDKAVSQSHPNPSEVRMGMASPNPLTLFPAPDIDADYTLFISRDFEEDTITVRWSTDLMPNHGFLVEKNGTVLKERVVNSLPGSLIAPEIFLRLNSKTNGGADSITTLPG